MQQTNVHTKQDWRQIIKPYNYVDLKKSYWQMLTTLALYVGFWFLAYEAFQVSVWACVGVAALAQLFYGRLFIFMHDCGHGTMFDTKKSRTFWGYVTGIIWLTPYWQWTKAHATHHRHSGDLDHRGIGDIWTMTVDEYEKASPMLKFAYRICRFPPFIILGGGVYAYLLSQRVFHKADGKRERRSVVITNIAIVVMAVAISMMTSAKFYFIYQFSIVYMGSALAVLLFYVQHQFENVYWNHKKNWDFETAAIDGCSVLKIPRIFQWASGNIGFHNIHHLCHTIPNYHLEKAYKENVYFQQSRTLTMWEMFKCFNLALYDMDARRLISFKTWKKNVKAQEKASLLDLAVQKQAI